MCFANRHGSAVLLERTGNREGRRNRALNVRTRKLTDAWRIPKKAGGAECLNENGVGTTVRAGDPRELAHRTERRCTLSACDTAGLFRLAATVGMAALALGIGLAKRFFTLRAAILACRCRAGAGRIRTFLIRHLILQGHLFRRAVDDLFGRENSATEVAREAASA